MDDPEYLKHGSVMDAERARAALDKLITENAILRKIVETWAHSMYMETDELIARFTGEWGA